MARGSQPIPEVSLRPFEPAADLPRLREWLQRPHVARWWGSPDEAFEAARHRSPGAHALITDGGVPVGYLCWERPSYEELEAAGLTDLPGDLVDVDVLLGEVEVLGRGIGPLAGALLLDRLRAAGQASCVGVGMSASNKRALRAAEKAGFRLAKAFDDPESGPCLYLVLHVSPTS